MNVPCVMCRVAVCADVTDAAAAGHLLLKLRLMVVKLGPSSDSLSGMVPDRLLLHSEDTQRCYWNALSPLCNLPLLHVTESFLALLAGS